MEVNTDTKVRRKLFIGGLNHDTDERTLQGFYEQWGEVVDCVIMKDNVKRSRGFGFITYKEGFQLQNAQKNKPHIIDGKEVDAKVAIPKEDQEQGDANREQVRKIFVGGLNYETTVAGLQQYFAKFGNIVDCHVMKNNDGRSRGFGFVTFSEVSHLEEAQRRRPHIIDGKEVETKRAMPKESGENNMSVTKMFVGGLKDDSTEEGIRQVFSTFGNIESVDILKDKTSGRPRGFGFVVFTDYDSVDRAVLKKRHDLNGSTVEVRKAVGKDQMTSRGPGSAPGGYGGARERWMDGPPRNFSNGGRRFDRGGGDGGYGNYRGQGGRDRYENNYGGPGGRGGGYNSNYGGGGYNDNNFGGSDGRGGNFGYSGGGGFGSNYGGGDSFDRSGSGGNSYGGPGGNYGGPSGGGYNNSFGGSGGSGGYNNSYGSGYNNNFDGSSGSGSYNNNFGGSSGGGNSSGGYNSFGSSSGSGGAGGYQQQSWSGSGYGDKGSNSGNGFGNSYGNDYNGGPMRSGSGYASRGQGPYGGAYGSGGSGSNRGNNSGGTGWR